jgi:hypothetical protein
MADPRGGDDHCRVVPRTGLIYRQLSPLCGANAAENKANSIRRENAHNTPSPTSVWGSHSIKRPETVGERKTRGTASTFGIGMPSPLMARFQTEVGPMVAQFRPTMGRGWKCRGREQQSPTFAVHDRPHLCRRKDAADAAAGVIKDPGKCDDGSLASTLAGGQRGMGVTASHQEDRDRKPRCRRPVSHPVSVDYTLLRRATRRFFPREEVISHSRRCPPPRWTRSTCDARASKTSHLGQHGPVNGRR